MINRKKEPAFSLVENIQLVTPQILDVSSKVKLFWMKEVPNDTACLVLFFDAGSRLGGKEIPSLVNNLLFSGTQNSTSTEIHEKIDALGGYIDTNFTTEHASVSIYCLREYLIPIARIVHDAIENVAFHETEITDLVNSTKQRILVSQQKVGYLSQVAFKKALFQSHPNYAYTTQISDLEAINTNDLKLFLRNQYLNGLTKIHVVGNFESDQVDELIDLFGKWAAESRMPFDKNFESHPQRIDVSKPDSVQASIKIGCLLFNRTHPDYIDFIVLNTLLGDYFGSRLMSNIREDKGYTYGIGSNLMEMNQFGFFIISTEVRKEVVEDTLQEIKKEIEKLQNELVESEELELVKNYILGQILKAADGPFSMLSLYANVEKYGLDVSYYQNLLKQVKEINSKRIQELANKYLQWKDLLIVTAGK